VVAEEMICQTIKTRIGELEFTHDFANGYPTDASVEKLYNERDFQRAARPISGLSPLFHSRHGNEALRKTLEQRMDRSFPFYLMKQDVVSLLRMLTTPYYLGFADLSCRAIDNRDAGAGRAGRNK
jgi:hypothetical protein